MKLLKWGIFFIFAFVVSFIILRTFSQDVFKEAVPARLLGNETPAIPIYMYIAGAFTLGLLIGLFVAVYNFVTSASDSFKKSKRLKELEKEVDFLKDQQANMSPVEDGQLLKESFEDTVYARDFLKKETEEGSEEEDEEVPEEVAEDEERDEPDERVEEEPQDESKKDDEDEIGDDEVGSFLK